MSTGLRFLDATQPDTFAWARDSDYDALIGAMNPSLWLVPDAERVTIAGGVVTAVTDRANGIARAGGPEPSGPLVIPNAIGGKPALRFPSGVSPRRFVAASNALRLGGDFSVVALLKLDPDAAATRQIVITANAGNPHFAFAVLSGRLEGVLRDPSGAQVRTLTPAGSVPQAGIVPAVICYEQAEATAWISHSLGLNWYAPASGTNPAMGVAPTTLSLQVGALNPTTHPLIGEIADLLVLPVSLHRSANALMVVRQYYRDRYLLDYLED